MVSCSYFKIKYPLTDTKIYKFLWKEIEKGKSQFVTFFLLLFLTDEMGVHLDNQTAIGSDPNYIHEPFHLRSLILIHCVVVSVQTQRSHFDNIKMTHYTVLLPTNFFSWGRLSLGLGLGSSVHVRLSSSILPYMHVPHMSDNWQGPGSATFWWDVPAGCSCISTISYEMMVPATCNTVVMFLISINRNWDKNKKQTKKWSEFSHRKD